jgi:hypothetical protein
MSEFLATHGPAILLLGVIVSVGAALQWLLCCGGRCTGE